MADQRDTQDRGQSAQPGQQRQQGQQGQQAGGQVDENSPVQRELAREERERSAVGDDVAENRNLSGSTTWETLAEQAGEGGEQQGGQRQGGEGGQRA